MDIHFCTQEGMFEGVLVSKRTGKIKTQYLKNENKWIATLEGENQCITGYGNTKEEAIKDIDNTRKSLMDMWWE
jgi:hypothetical protein